MMTRDDLLDDTAAASPTGVEVNDPERVRRLIAEHRRTHGPAASSAPRPAAAAGAGAGDVTAEGTRFDLVLRGDRVFGEDGFAPREVGIRDGRIAAIAPRGAGLLGEEVVELAPDETLLPGLVDAHVHVNEPGRTEGEGFASATRAAAAGGVTTILDMPLNSVPSTVNSPALEYKQLFAERNAFVDVGFWAGAVPGNLPEMRSDRKSVV